jgi:hypothetical protein
LSFAAVLNLKLQNGTSIVKIDSVGWLKKVSNGENFASAVLRIIPGDRALIGNSITFVTRLKVKDVNKQIITQSVQYLFLLTCSDKCLHEQNMMSLVQKPGVWGKHVCDPYFIHLF